MAAIRIEGQRPIKGMLQLPVALRPTLPGEGPCEPGAGWKGCTPPDEVVQLESAHVAGQLRFARWGDQGLDHDLPDGAGGQESTRWTRTVYT